MIGQDAADGPSLATVLDVEGRQELTRLLAEAMAAMRQQIEPAASAKIAHTTLDASESTAPSEIIQKALQFFDEWRTRVLNRVAEVVDTQPSTTASGPEKSSSVQPHDERQVKLEAADDQHAETKILPQLYPPIQTSIAHLPRDAKILVVHSVLLLLLSLERYLAPSRILLLHLITSLHLDVRVLLEDEGKMAQGLVEAAKQMSGDDETQKKADENSVTRKWKVGLASVAGAALIGVTGGLAAPLVAAGVGSVMGGLGLGATAAAGYLGTVAGSSVIVGGLFGAYGGRMTGRMMDKYAKEVSDFAFVPLSKTQSLDGSVQERRLRVTIGITGWLTSKDQVVEPWAVLGSTTEAFALRFELESLLSLGNSLDAMVSSAAWGYAKTEIIKQTVFAGLADAAMWPMTLLQLGRVVDNPFSVARSRADKAGEVLADALINRAQGERPVTLIGYSLGARVIYSCLQSLARRSAFGLIESAIFIGAPCPSDLADWQTMRAVVAGRLVNVYSQNDYVLGFLYRSSSMQYGVAGLQKVEGFTSIENIDVSESVSGHLQYRYLIGNILTKIGYEDVDADAVQLEEAMYRELLEKSRLAKLAEGAKSKTGKVLEDNPLGIHSSKDESQAAELEAQRMEQQVQEKTQKGMLESARNFFGGSTKHAQQATQEIPPRSSKGSPQETGWAQKLSGGLL